jgi:hypothetical protein
MRKLNTFLKLATWLLIALGAVAKSLKTLIFFPEFLVIHSYRLGLCKKIGNVNKSLASHFHMLARAENSTIPDDIIFLHKHFFKRNSA